ncbi:vacuolar fusion protein MON1 homolog A-like [Stylophora pistillata]|uniref:Vacuolar fusion protein MON1 homolog n=1 Tax=Stylophora pistillata TaxID=50429 RepID=A0A2B4SR23_STYPI|nr:vacuolar fusion protein MON1 homolog A-like [Stylophora pistillata]PFX31569.1 Vacuolar fusion protein MON1-like A [Stylophora pistillata]
MAAAIDPNAGVECEEQEQDILQGTEPGAGSVGYEPLFCVQPDEELDVSVDEICTDPESRTSAHSDTSLTSGHISSLSSHGSPEAANSSSPKIDVIDEDENFNETFLPAQADMPSEAASPIDEKIALLSVQDEQEEARKTRAASVQEIGREASVEDVNNPQWTLHKKHVFAFSEAGKPIYSRYGNEDKLATLMGVMQALVSFVQDGKNTIRCIMAGNHKFVFLVRGHVILVAVAYTPESVTQLVLQLSYVYNQILSVLTYTQLARIMEQRRNYDLRRLLAGTEKFIDNLLNLMDHEPSFLLGSVRCLPLSSSVRETIGQSMLQARVKDLVFAILVAKNQLITLIRPKRYSLHPSDLHLIFNLVSASTSFQTAESWTPICLPRFDNSGYLYAHISYLDDNCPACLLLLSTDRDAFFELAETRLKTVERLKRYRCLEAINEAVAKKSYSTDQVGIPELYHFIYKSKSTAQYTSPELEAPYVEPEEQERLFGLYLYLHHRIHSPARPLKILCHVGIREMLLGWVTSGFELYAAFSPLVTKPDAIVAINKLLRWIKREEDRLFILSSQVF